MSARRTAGLAAAALLALAAPAKACVAAILLAVDVSSSVDAEEYRLQTVGMGAAFADPEVIAAIETGGGAEIAVLFWSGWQHQEIRLPWRRVATRAQAEALAVEIAALPRRYGHWGTDMGHALAAAGGAFQGRGLGCQRRVVDVAGDGVSNHGPSTARMRDALVAEGLVINGLVIKGADPDPEAFYRQEVIGGPGAFIEIAAGYADYARAFRRKLLRELRPLFSELRPGP